MKKNLKVFATCAQIKIVSKKSKRIRFSVKKEKNKIYKKLKGINKRFSGKKMLKSLKKIKKIFDKKK